MIKKLTIAITAAALLTFSAGTLAAQNSTARPVQLKALPTAPINLHMNEDAKGVYQALGKVLGLTVSFDPDYQSKVVQVDISNATPTEAMQIVGDLTGTFYLPVTPDTILVATNSRQKHLDLDYQYDQTFYLKNSPGQADANEVVAAMRNMLTPESKVYLVSSQNALVVRTNAENIARAQKVLDDLDHPRKTYRLTYTVTEVDGARKIGSQHFAMVLLDGQRTSLNQTSRVPVATGTYQGGNGPVQTQFTYSDVGLKFDATLNSTAAGAKLNSSVTQSGFIDEKSPDGSQNNPLQRQLTLEGSAMLSNGKPLVLGSMDIPGSTRHLDVEVVMEPLP